MSCNRPFNIKDKQGNIVSVPCGMCLQCRIDKVNEWTDRFCFEISQKNGAFVTLTYNDDNLPYQLEKTHVQAFLKRLRQNLKRKYNQTVKIKYLAVGEYSPELLRPHYHLVITGISPLKERKVIEDSWQQGFVMVLPAQRGSIRYVLKYMDKEYLTPEQQIIKYGDRTKPFRLFSQGIGLDFIYQNLDRVREEQGYWLNGKFRPLPRYYKQKFGLEPIKEAKLTHKQEVILDYMHKHNCTYNQAMNRLGIANEKDILGNLQVHQKIPKIK